MYISSQNHGYVVDMETVPPDIAVPAFVNVNDGTNEGLNMWARIFSRCSTTLRPAPDHWIPVTCLTVS